MNNSTIISNYSSTSLSSFSNLSNIILITTIVNNTFPNITNNSYKFINNYFTYIIGSLYSLSTIIW